MNNEKNNDSVFIMQAFKEEIDITSKAIDEIEKKIEKTKEEDEHNLNVLKMRFILKHNYLEMLEEMQELEEKEGAISKELPLVEIDEEEEIETEEE